MPAPQKVLCKRIVSQEEYDRVENISRNATMSREQREAQLVSFVWGNAPDGDTGTFDTVRKNLGLSTEN